MEVLFVFKDQSKHVIMDSFTLRKKKNVFKFVEMEKTLEIFSAMMEIAKMEMVAPKLVKYKKILTVLLLIKHQHVFILEQST